MIPSQPIHNPPAPFCDSFGVLRPGSTFQIKGLIPHGGQQFQVNFACGNVLDGPSRSDIAFHFNPRPGQGYVARNAFVGQVWGPEEGEQPVFPFQPGQSFELLILVEPTQFKVAVNGLHFITFNHRVQMERCNTLQIYGDVQLQLVQFVDPSYTPGYGAPPPPANALYDPIVPFDYVIPGGMYPGKAILINGRALPAADRFQVNLICNDSFRGPETIALHFNPRFSEVAVVRNSLIDGLWGEEERQVPSFPFSKGAPFDLQIVCDPNQFIIYVNGQHFCGYKHRLPLNFVDRVGVAGDLNVSTVNFQG